MPTKSASASGGKNPQVSIDTFLTSPAILGWSNIAEPDAAFGELKFKVDAHFDEDAQALLAEAVDTKVIEPLWDKFLADADKLGKAPPKGGWVRPTGQEWVEEHLKEPKEKDRIQVPFLRFTNQAEYVDKNGDTKRKTMRVVGLQKDGSSVIIDKDLVAENKAKGSKVRVITRASLYASPAINKGQVGLSIKFGGIQVLKLEVAQRNAGSDLDGLSDAELEALGTDFEAEDFSQYAPAKKDQGDGTKKERAPVQDDLDDEDLGF